MMEIPEGPVPLDPERIDALARVAIETHAEASALMTLRDSGSVIQTLEIVEGEDGEPEMHLYFDKPAEEIAAMKEKAAELGDDPDVIPDRIHIAAWPLSECLPSQN